MEMDSYIHFCNIPKSAIGTQSLTDVVWHDWLFGKCDLQSSL